MKILKLLFRKIFEFFFTILFDRHCYIMECGWTKQMSYHLFNYPVEENVDKVTGLKTV